jgi:hypothetical protein
VRAQIETCRDSNFLDRWLVRAATAVSIADVVRE